MHCVSFFGQEVAIIAKHLDMGNVEMAIICFLFVFFLPALPLDEAQPIAFNDDIESGANINNFEEMYDTPSFPIAMLRT